MPRVIAALNGEGFLSTITERADKSVIMVADGDIDADGANGQHGARAAYRSDDKGSEALANGGMGIRNGKVVFTKSWGPDIALSDRFGNPLVNDDGVIITKTAYRFPGFSINDPAAYVDSETVPYIVVPPCIVNGVSGVVKGCQAFVTYKGKRIACMVGDVGPRTKNGEISIELARRLGINPSPRSGGIDTPDLTYEIYPGIPAVVDGITYPLIKS
jgi:hypothetical protein